MLCVFPECTVLYPDHFLLLTFCQARFGNMDTELPACYFKACSIILILSNNLYNLNCS